MLYEQLVRPLLFRLDPEQAHDLLFRNMKRLQQSQRFLQLTQRFIARQKGSEKNLSRHSSGLFFPNPTGLAAGFDKNAALIPALTAAGFGFLEIGSITARPHSGNPKPRMFRLPDDRALINRMGLNNNGAARIMQQLRRYHYSSPIPLGVNIAKTPLSYSSTQESIEDYVISFKEAVKGADYITLNISCPNTGDGKSFEDPALFEALLQAVKPVRNSGIPLFIKFSSDTSDARLSQLLEIAEAYEINGYVAVNTSNSRNGLKSSPELIRQIGRGGLSGKPLAEKARSRIRLIRSQTRPERTLISVGGIMSPGDAHQRLEEGADLIQLYTGLVYEGPKLPGRINKYLAAQKFQKSSVAMDSSNS